MIFGKILSRCMCRRAFTSARSYSKKQNPFVRTWDVISKEIPVLFGKKQTGIVYPEHADIVIIGGGFIGSSVAYWLKTRAGAGLSIVVLEKDLTYKDAQKTVSLGTVVQHYSLPENILLAQYGAEFMRNIKQNLNSDVDLQYFPYGHLVLASEQYAGTLEHNVAIQREFGVKNELLSVDEINKRYPWINTHDVRLDRGANITPYVLSDGTHSKLCRVGGSGARTGGDVLSCHPRPFFVPLYLKIVFCASTCTMFRAAIKFASDYNSADVAHCYVDWFAITVFPLGCIGTESEGSFNSWALLQGLVQKSVELGTQYVNAEVIGFELIKQRDLLMEGVEAGTFEKINRVKYRTADNEEHGIVFAGCILAAGDKSGEIAKLANVGTGKGLLAMPLPIEKRESKVYSIENSAHNTGLNTPIVMDTSGLWLRRNGLQNDLLCGHIPMLTAEIKELPQDEYYNTIVQPSIINRVPIFKDFKVNSLTTESHDFNVYDDTGILGPHPYHNNMYIAAGFGKQGSAHAAGVGRAIAELIIDSHFIAIDLTRFTFDRLLTDQPLIESNVY